MKILNIISFLGMCVLASLYIVAGLMDHFGNVQIVSMVDWQDSNFGWHLHFWYAMAMILCTIALALMIVREGRINKILTVMSSLLIGTVTAIILLVANIKAKNPAIFEKFTGEIVTIVFSMMAIAVVIISNKVNRINKQISIYNSG